MRSWTGLLLLIMLLISGGIKVDASKDFHIKVNGNNLSFSEPIFIKDSRIYVPVRYVTESVGSSVKWDGEKRIVSIDTPIGDKLEFIIDQKAVRLNDERFYMDAAPIIRHKRTYLPLRHVSELIHHDVKWSGEKRIADINKVPLYTVQKGDSLGSIAKEYQTGVDQLKKRNQLVSDVIMPGYRLKVEIPTFISEPVVSQKEVKMLARIIHAESKGESYKGKLAVGNVIMNRVEDRRFPDTIESVIFQANQFTPVKTGVFYQTTPSYQSINAAREVLLGKEVVSNALFFYNPRLTSSYFLTNRPTVAVIGKHVFAK